MHASVPTTDAIPAAATHGAASSPASNHLFRVALPIGMSSATPPPIPERNCPCRYYDSM